MDLRRVAVAGTGMMGPGIAATFALADVREAFRLLEQRHTLGKIVLEP